MNDSLSQHCPNCEAQAAEIEYWKTEARNVRRELKSEQKQADSAMDNYDAIHRRCEAQAAEIEKLREELRQIEVDAAETYNDWCEAGCDAKDAIRFAFDIGTYCRAALGETK